MGVFPRAGSDGFLHDRPAFAPKYQVTALKGMSRMQGAVVEIVFKLHTVGHRLALLCLHAYSQLKNDEEQDCLFHG